MGYHATKEAIRSTFAQTGLDYVDLYVRTMPFARPLRSSDCYFSNGI